MPNEEDGVIILVQDRCLVYQSDVHGMTGTAQLVVAAGNGGDIAPSCWLHQASCCSSRTAIDKTYQMGQEQVVVFSYITRTASAVTFDVLVSPCCFFTCWKLLLGLTLLLWLEVLAWSSTTNRDRTIPAWLVLVLKEGVKSSIKSYTTFE